MLVQMSFCGEVGYGIWLKWKAKFQISPLSRFELCFSQTTREKSGAGLSATIFSKRYVFQRDLA